MRRLGLRAVGYTACMALVLIGAFVGAVVAFVLQKLFTKDPANEVAALRTEFEDFKKRTEERQNERSRKAALLRFRPHAYIRGEAPDQQLLIFTGDQEFSIKRIEYVADFGMPLGDDRPDMTGTHVEVPIDAVRIKNIYAGKGRRTGEIALVTLWCYMRFRDVNSRFPVIAYIQPLVKEIGGAREVSLNVTITP
jgi:hypothetical protein